MKEDVKLLSVLSKKNVTPPPIWLMRQAGRYLPEYRALRAKAGSFWTMCMSPEMAKEITLQPIQRFGFDSAILFSDILTIPYALGLDVVFEESIGPTLTPITTTDALRRDEKEWARRLSPAYETLRMVRAELDSQTALLGFAGAPWTLATYMAEGKGSSDQRAAKLWGYNDPQGFARLLDILGDCVALHLVRQLDAGADAVQLFDSWASGLPEREFADWVIAPTKRIVEKVRAVKPDAKIIGFPRATTLAGYEAYANETGVDAVSIDTAVPPRWAAKILGKRVAVQGNLDPIALIAGGDALAAAVDRIVDAFEGVPFIFNLGHGILPETPVEHVAQLIACVRSSA
ncbi:MAG: uroporphyrinogen decarboxylase [Proteobacteria bacterium]|nr:uroporphyrinogen decarboxylase [Pseudomonadota bacterium]